jgi:PRTRC genetic system protein A
MKMPKLVERKFLRSTDQTATAPLYEISIAQNGTFKRAKRREMSAVVKISSFRAPIRELAIAENRVDLKEKIPVRIFEEILSHARNSTEKGSFTENLYAISWDEETGGYLWDEISRARSFGSTIASTENLAYQRAILEVHTHPAGCRHFSSQDDRDESGKFRLFGILVDIHSENPLIRLRVGVYDSFAEIPLASIVDEPSEKLIDAVTSEAEIAHQLEQQEVTYIFAEEYLPVSAQNSIENV